MAEVLLYGIIGDAYDKLDASTVTTTIRASTGPLSVRINSPGGFVMEGLAIIAALRSYQGKVTVHIDGLAASMASAIAMVGDEVIMAESSLMMIHRPWDSSIGHADQLRADADKLEKIEAQLVSIYCKRTGIPEGDLKAMMAQETWFSAEEALAAGFATSIEAPLKIAARARASGFGFRHVPDFLKQQEASMPEQNDTTGAVALERTRISSIMALGTKHRIPETLTQDLVTRGINLEQASAAILDHLAAEGDRAGIGHTHGSGAGCHHTTLDNPAIYGEAIRDALVAKISGRAATGPASDFQAMSVTDMARDWLARGGVRDVNRIAADRVVSMAMQSRPQGSWGASGSFGGMHTTSDFPDLIGGAAEKYLIDRYVLQQSPLKQLARQASRSNFLTQYGVLIDGGLGPLDTVNEAGEFKNRTLNTRKEGYALRTYGNMLAVSRQMLVNDSLNALADVLNIMAGDAAETEAIVLAAIINNYVMSDGKPLFHASHGNLAPVGAVPSIATLDAGRLAMRSQRTASGGLIDAKPKFLLVPVALETLAETLVSSSIAPAAVDMVNPFSNRLTPIADPRLTSTSWYLFADPTMNPALEYAYLNGQAAPSIDSQDGWRVDGVEWRVRHDFGAGALDARLAWKNPGA